MSDGIMGIFGSMLSAKESYQKRKEALKEAFGVKMLGEERWKAYKSFKERRKPAQGQPKQQQGQDNYPQGTLGDDFGTKYWNTG